MRRIDPWFAIGLFAFFALLFVALFGERIAPYEPIYFVVNRGDLQRLFARHHLPHLVPILAVSTAQQAVASLVAVAELGVLGIFVGATKFVNLSESVGALTFLRPTDVGALWISEIPEWGGLLANGRGIQNLWTTRWVILVPGVAFAVA